MEILGSLSMKRAVRMRVAQMTAPFRYWRLRKLIPAFVAYVEYFTSSVRPLFIPRVKAAKEARPRRM